MPFSSLLFLTAFFPLFLMSYWSTRSLFVRNWVVLFFSAAFIFWGAPTFALVLLVLGVWDFYLGNRIIAIDDPRRKRVFLFLGITVHLLTLFYFKYLNLFVFQLGRVLIHFSAHPLTWEPIILPIGVSFTTFEGISYLVDVYRGQARPPKKVRHYLIFLMMFPHSIAGPIFRWKSLAEVIETRSHSIEQVREGLVRFCLGLGKKILVADRFAALADLCFSMPVDDRGVVQAWFGALAYAFQIYFDFSGYSDMAIGMGSILGFKFDENFAAPYLSRTMDEFWKRWHISLSTWMRDYLYIPLGGGRVEPWRKAMNVLVVFSLSGFWHGASLNFLAWGFYHGLLVLLDRSSAISALRGRLPDAFNILFTFLLVVMGWVLFRAPDYDSAVAYLASMFFLKGFSPASQLCLHDWNHASQLIFLGIATFCLFTESRRIFNESARFWVSAASLFLSIAYLSRSNFSPFIYFKF